MRLDLFRLEIKMLSVTFYLKTQTVFMNEESVVEFCRNEWQILSEWKENHTKEKHMPQIRIHSHKYEHI